MVANQRFGKAYRYHHQGVNELDWMKVHKVKIYNPKRWCNNKKRRRVNTQKNQNKNSTVAEALNHI